MKEFLETLLKVEIVRVGICSLEFRIHGVHEYANLRPSTPLRLSTHIWPMMEFCYSATAIPLAYGRQVIIISMTSLLCLSI